MPVVSPCPSAFRSNPANVNKTAYVKPSNTLTEIDAFLQKYRVLSSLGHIVSAINARTTPGRLGYLVALASNYDLTNPNAIADLMLNNYEAILPFFKWVANIGSNPTSPQNLEQIRETVQQADELVMTLQSTVDGTSDALYNPEEETVSFSHPQIKTGTSLWEHLTGLKIDLSKTLEEQKDLGTSILQTLKPYMPLLRPLLGFLSFLACAFGATNILGLDAIANISSNMLTLSKQILARRVVMDEINKSVDMLLEGVYSVFGQTYVTPKLERLHMYSEKLTKLTQDLDAFILGTHVDAFGILRCHSFEDYQRVYDECNREFITLTEQEGSTFNFGKRLAHVHDTLQNIRERKRHLVKSTAGKQEPVKIWLYGRPGVGKTRIANLLSRELVPRGTTYSRTHSDEYWNGYAGQAVTIFDDILQNPSGTDALAWHEYATTASRDVVMASLAEKGTPFTSRFMIATSNMAYMNTCQKISNVESFNRRRDFLVLVKNDALTSKLVETQGSSPSDQWWIDHPNEYHLFNPNPSGQGNPTMEVSASNSAYIGQCTFEELVIMAREKEIALAEAYRSALSKIEELKPYIKLPAPFDVKPHLFEAHVIYDRVMKHQRYSVCQPSHEIKRMVEEEGESTLSTLSEQAVNISPVKVTSYDRHQPITIYGPPGIGKSHLTRELANARTEEVVKIDVNSIRENSHNNYGVLHGKFVIFDDFTMTPETIECYRSLVYLYDQGSIPLAGLIGTGNPKVRIYGVQEKEMIDRRSVVINLTLSTVPSLVLAKMKKKFSIEEYLADDRDKKIHLSVQNQRHGLFRDYASLLQNIIDHFSNKRATHHEVVSMTSLVLPFPENYDYLVTIPLRMEELEGYRDSVSVASIFNKIVIKKYENGESKTVSVLERMKLLAKCMPLAQRTSASGSIRAIVAQINTEHHDSPIDGHCVVAFADVSFGMMSCEGRLIAYEIDCDDDIVTVIDDVIHVNGIAIRSDEANEIYHKAIKQAFTIVPSVENDDAVNRSLFLRTTTWLGEAMQYLIPAVSLFIQSLAVFGLCGELKKPFRRDYSSDSDSEAPPRRLKRERKRRQPERPAQLDSDNERNNNKPSSNAVTVERLDRERKRRLLGGTHQDNSDNERNNDAQPRTRVVAERKRRTMAPAPQLDSDTERNNNKASPNKIQPENASQYSQQRPKKHNVLLECTNTNGAIVMEGNENTGYNYGVIHSGQVFYALEVAQGKWQMMTVPITNQWEELDVAKLSDETTVARGKPFKITFIKRTLDETSVASLRSATWDFGINSEMDVGSVIAFALAYGVPYDVDLNTLWPNKCAQLFHKDSPFVIPKALLGYLSHTFPHTALMVRKTMNPEGCVDPTALQYVNTVDTISKSLKQGGKHVVYGTLIGGNKVLTVGHVHDLQLTIDVHNKEWPLKLVTRHATHDVALFAVDDKAFPAAPKALNKFMTNEELTNCMSKALRSIPGALLVAPREGLNTTTSRVCELDFTHRTTTKEVRGKQLTYKVVTQAFHSGLSEPGDCGSLVMMYNRQLTGKYFAIHYAGCQTISAGTIVTRDWIQEMLETPEMCMAEPEAIIPLIAPTEINMREQAKVDAKNGLLYVGQMKNGKKIHSPTTTRMHRTGLRFPAYDIYEPSIMSKRDPRITTGFDPLEDGLKRYGTSGTTHTADREEVRDAFREIGNELATRITIKGQNVRVFTKTEALNKPDALEYPNAKAIDRSGSAGFPINLGNGHGTSKGDYLIFNEKHQKYYFSPEGQEISNKIENLIQHSKKGIQHIMPFTAYLKDESLKLKKIYEKPKTRLFFSGPFEFLIAFRQYFLASQLRVMSMYADIPVKVGISASMPDWHKMLCDAESVSSFGFASDVENFDSGVPQVFLEESLRVFEEIYGRCSIAKEDVAEGNTVRENLHRCIEGAYVASKGSLFKLTQAQVSGNPATAVENSFIMWALYYLVWKRLALVNAPEHANYASFRKNVYLAVYGDDNFCTVAPECPWFNFNTFQQEAAKFGFKITDAAKTGGVTPDYQDLTELEFLKRSFSKLNGYWVGPLAITSIAKSLMWIRDGSYDINRSHVPSLGGEWPLASCKETITTSIDNMWAELALHGEETYNQWRDDILIQCSTFGYDVSPPLWRQACALNHYYV